MTGSVVANETESKQQSARQQGLRVYRFDNRFVAYARAVNLLRAVEPYASYKFGGFAGTLAGQIERGHYLFAARGEKIVGYAGWAMCDEALARAWMDGRQRPSYEDCCNGECVVMMTVHAVSGRVLSFMAREGRRLFPNRKIIFARQYTNGKPRRVGEVFNRTNRGQASVVE